MLKTYKFRLCFIFAITVPGACLATPYFVDNNNPNCTNQSGDGSENTPWCEIYHAFGTGLDNCRANSPLQAGDEVLVAPGTYNGFRFCGKAVTVRPSSNTGGRIITYTVKFQNGEGQGSILGSLEHGMGFTIRDSSSHGVYVNGAAPKILGNRIENNDGTGIHVTTDGAPLIEGNFISGNGNPLTECGGGIYLGGSSVTLHDNVICKNRAGNGGGICAQNLNASHEVSIIDCIVEENTALAEDEDEGLGGGIYAHGLESTLSISRTIIRDNRAAEHGGGVIVIPSESFAEAIYCPNGVITLNIESSIFLENRNINGYADGGGISLGDCVEATITNCTILNNFAQDVGGGLAILGGSNVVITNSIFWSNDSGGSQDQIGVEESGVEPTVTYSDIEGGYDGSGNIDDDPLFCAPSVYNYHLRAESPCIDVGNNSAVVGNDDYDGNPRIVDGPDAGTTATVDMGCYEYQYDSDRGCTLPGVPKRCPDCETANVVSIVPANGKRDVRQPHPINDNSFAERQGIGSPNSYTDGPEPITIELDITGADSPDCWSLCETGIETIEGDYLDVNYISSVTEVDWGMYEILLDRPISGGHWTTISYFAGDEFAEYASLPGDINYSGAVAGSDLLEWLDCCYYSTCTGYGKYRCDIDHSGAVTTGDYLTLIDLLNGASDFIVWSGASLPDNCCPEGCDAFGAVAPTETELNEIAAFSPGVVAFLTSADPIGEAAIAEFEIFADGLTSWAVMHLSAAEKQSLAGDLQDVNLTFASEAGAAAAVEMAKALMQ